ncbi:hypothetical protein D3Y59_13395 [Hymenobacter oligotrophus]|uniref:Uncharacterized protein n=2 Tax=Cytophagales TaxID=768507 RepID=A0A3B7R3N5_9BACT|nr:MULTISPECIES: hypothetical protein [Cytophagales]AYA37950.1 hypothetical protein D3Y59_13395 [Hymenobacter oligotrophus]KUG05941.1 hypothetical protein ASU33_00730 [Solirubrum puertoriconensis]UYZ58349.1 hypothetical protein OIS50_14940 [Hymenobacter sp. YIM 151858-1]
MPYKSNNTNKQSKENHGDPAGEGQPRAVGQLPVTNRDDETEERLEQLAKDAPQAHPNRNLNKPDLDKPSYGGGH